MKSLFHYLDTKELIRFIVGVSDKCAAKHSQLEEQHFDGLEGIQT